MELSFEQGRVLGAMIEKAMTTPANYPMSLNGVVVACNQVSNREPVVEFTEAAVEQILRGLTDAGLAKMVHRPGDRVVKYRQALDDALETNTQQTALLAVLLLRSAQTPGELRQRTGRYVDFTSLPELEQVLADLGERGLVRRLARQPGQKESRYEELLTTGGGGAPLEPAAPELEEEAAAWAGEAPVPGESRNLAAELDELKRRFEVLLGRLGEEID